MVIPVYCIGTVLRTMSYVSLPHKLQIFNTIDDIEQLTEVSGNPKDAKKAAHEYRKSSSLSLVKIKHKVVKKWPANLKELVRLQLSTLSMVDRLWYGSLTS